MKITQKNLIIDIENKYFKNSYFSPKQHCHIIGKITYPIYNVVFSILYYHVPTEDIKAEKSHPECDSFQIYLDEFFNFDLSGDDISLSRKDETLDEVVFNILSFLNNLDFNIINKECSKETLLEHIEPLAWKIASRSL